MAGLEQSKRRCGIFVLSPGGAVIRKLALLVWKEDAGEDLSEYALPTVLVSLAAIASMQALATAMSTTYSNAVTKLTTM